MAKTNETKVEKVRWLKEAQNWLVLVFDAGEEIGWSLQGFLTAPGQSFLARSYNNGQFILPILLLQILANLAHIALTIAIAALEEDEKDKAKRTFFKIAKRALVIGLIVAIAVTVTLVSAKLFLIFCYVQAAFDILVSGASFFSNAWKYLNLSPNSADADADAQQLEQKLTGNVKYAVIAAFILTLTIFSFSPIPIIANVAQVILAVVVISLIVHRIWERYQEKKAEKAAKTELENSSDKENNSMAPALKPAPKAAPRSFWAVVLGPLKERVIKFRKEAAASDDPEKNSLINQGPEDSENRNNETENVKGYDHVLSQPQPVSKIAPVVETEIAPGPSGTTQTKHPHGSEYTPFFFSSDENSLLIRSEPVSEIASIASVVETKIAPGPSETTQLEYHQYQRPYCSVKALP